MSEQPEDPMQQLKNENFVLNNRLLYLEQVVVSFVAHFNKHGHTDPITQSASSIPPRFQLPAFNPKLPPMLPSKALILAPKVETEVIAPNAGPRPVFMRPPEKPQPMTG